MGAPLKNNLPYQPTDPTQKGFATFGQPHIQQSIAEISVYALRAVWYQKWMVHRKLRPEEAGGRLDRHKNGFAVYPLHSDVLSSPALTQTFAKFGSYLLPQAFAEGAPTHPSYGAGHATVAGACSTLLKFWFDESFVLPNPVAPSADGSIVNPILDVLTVGGEINKIAANVAYGRNIAGVHWRSDAVESLKLGEQMALAFLRDQKALYNEVMEPWTATGFDGTLLVV
jgi:membrane-associated phospholipid phosphatase